MPYAALTDFVARFGADELQQLTDSAAATPALDQALSDADDEINSYLAVRYTLPLASVPSVLVRVACDIARYRLWDQGASEEVANRYKAAIKFLTALSSGNVKLGVEPSPARTDDAPPLFSASSPVLDREHLHDYLHAGEL